MTSMNTNMLNTSPVIRAPDTPAYSTITTAEKNGRSSSPTTEAKAEQTRISRAVVHSIRALKTSTTNGMEIPFFHNPTLCASTEPSRVSQIRQLDASNPAALGAMYKV